MKEHDFIKIIKNLTNSPLLGDDCAYLKELGIVITQDNFVENIHFKTDWATPYQIGYKATVVNISDILASGAKPAYLSIGLSMPDNNEAFITELYKGILAGSYGAQIIGGDITGGETITISITAIGTTEGRKISSRSNAKNGYIVITSGEHGLSSKGLIELQKGAKNSPYILTHLEPQLDINFSQEIATQIKDEYAMMDTSDGLADALFQIAKASNCTIRTDAIEGMFGAEDYKLVAVIPETFLEKLTDYKYVGKVLPFNGYYLEVGNKKFSEYDELGLYNHFN